jgi:hypothetical protein
MYCSSCGTAVSPKLSYCSRCGAELNAKEQSVSGSSELSPDSLVWAIAAVTIVGLGTVIGLMAVMKEVVHFNEGIIMAFTLLCFLTSLGIDSVFIWLLLRSQKSVRQAGQAGDKIQLKELTTKELAETQARALNEVAPSLTEHTTRTLEPAHGERKS